MDTSETVGADDQGGVEHAADDAADRARPAPGHNDALGMALASAREHVVPQRYECLGCENLLLATDLNVKVQRDSGHWSGFLSIHVM